MNEAGKFLVLTDCIMTWEDHISFLMCFVMFACLWFLLVHKKTLQWAEQDLNQYEHRDPKENFPSHHPPLAYANTVPVILCQISIVSFLNLIKRLWKSGPTKTTERPVWLLSSFFICLLLLFHFVKRITIYLNRVKDKHTVWRGTSS